MGDSSLLGYLSNNFNIKYTKEQEKAVVHKEGNLLLLAAPGSGKTTVVVGRIGNLIHNNVNPESILALTFSKASAIDMDKRYTNLFGSMNMGKPRFSTIHSFANTILNEYAVKNNIGFTFIDEEKGSLNKHKLIKQCCFNLNKEYVQEDKLEDIIKNIGYVKNIMLSEKEIKNLKTGIKDFYNIYIAYESIKKENKYIDYDDMLTYAFNILKKDKTILKKYRERYKYIICDEAQDTSRIQHGIIWLLAKGKNNVFFVADDDQSIYGFRGSYPSMLKKFGSIYEKSSILYMERNFRSSEKIVTLTNKFIKANKERYDKNIYTKNPLGEDVKVQTFEKEEESLDYIINNISENKNDSIGILYRNNISAIPLVNKLVNFNMPFYIRDNKMGFFKHWILSDIKYFFNLSNNENDIEALEKIYFKTNSYISKNMIEYLKKNYNKDESVFTILLRYPLIEDYNRRSIINFMNSIKSLKNKKPYIALDYIENEMMYLDYLNKSYSKEDSYKNLNEIFGILKTLSRDLESIQELFQTIEYIKSKIAESSFNKNKSNITLSTIHSSKGLEYDKVYIIDAIEGIIPSYESIEEEKKGYSKLMEEERRLFYVAMTRAKNFLAIVSTKEKNDKRLSKSRFILEVNNILNPSEKNTVDYGIKIGDNVIHKAFGSGVVLNIEDDSIEINFSKLGIKKLLLSVCINGGILSLK